MRKAIAIAVICLAASLAFAATVKLQPLNVKPGLWQDTVATKYTGIPPQMAASLNSQVTFKTCLKPEGLDANAWAEDLARIKCSSLTVLKSTGTDLEVQGKGCEAGNGITADGHVKFHASDSEHVTGTADATASSTPFGGSASVHADYTDKWLGATCPAGMR